LKSSAACLLAPAGFDSCSCVGLLPGRGDVQKHTVVRMYGWRNALCLPSLPWVFACVRSPAHALSTSAVSSRWPIYAPAASDPDGVSSVPVDEAQGGCGMLARACFVVWLVLPRRLPLTLRIALLRSTVVKQFLACWLHTCRFQSQLPGCASGIEARQV
jgi:hypothetical protein